MICRCVFFCKDRCCSTSSNTAVHCCHLLVAIKLSDIKYCIWFGCKRRNDKPPDRQTLPWWPHTRYITHVRTMLEDNQLLSPWRRGSCVTCCICSAAQYSFQWKLLSWTTISLGRDTVSPFAHSVNVWYRGYICKSVCQRTSCSKLHAKLEGTA
jgi:hypothetical protein